MDITDSILQYRRFMKRRNYSVHTVKNYMNTLKDFIVWLDVPVEDVTPNIFLEYIDHLHGKRLSPKTINCHLDSIRGFYNYLYYEEQFQVENPVKRGYALRLSNPLPRYLREEELVKLFGVIKNLRDRAMFMLMLRCGLRVEEVASLSLNALDVKRFQLIVYNGKGGKDRVVYMSKDAVNTLLRYLKARPSLRVKKIFLVEKGTCRGKPISVRGIQKRIEYYSKKSGVNVSSHQLRHHADPAFECGCGSGYDPGSVGP
jgi:site-specific recombinase XerD